MIGKLLLLTRVAPHAQLAPPTFRLCSYVLPSELDLVWIQEKESWNDKMTIEVRYYFSAFLQVLSRAEFDHFTVLRAPLNFVNFVWLEWLEELLGYRRMDKTGIVFFFGCKWTLCYLLWIWVNRIVSTFLLSTLGEIDFTQGGIGASIRWDFQKNIGTWMT